MERQFEIVGEGINQLARIDPETASKITEFQRIISFRNILIHGTPTLMTELYGE